MLDAIRRGDRVVTGGGLIGIVAKVVSNGDEVLIDLADNVRVRAVRKHHRPGPRQDGAGGQGCQHQCQR